MDRMRRVANRRKPRTRLVLFVRKSNFRSWLNVRIKFLIKERSIACYHINNKDKIIDKSSPEYLARTMAERMGCVNMGSKASHVAKSEEVSIFSTLFTFKEDRFSQ